MRDSYILRRTYIYTSSLTYHEHTIARDKLNDLNTYNKFKMITNMKLYYCIDHIEFTYFKLTYLGTPALSCQDISQGLRDSRCCCHPLAPC